MSIFIGKQSLYDENKKARRSQVIMKRTKLPTYLKTKKCSLQLKGEKCYAANHIVNLSSQTFHLCDVHFTKFMSGSVTLDEPIVFQKAREL